MYKYKCRENYIEIEKDGYFSLEKTLDCGQCFRFEKRGDVYEGVALGKHLVLSENENSVFVKGVTENEFLSLFVPFFNLELDYKEINESIFSSNPEYLPLMTTAEGFGRGIRILSQDPFETLISFIISQNNNIPRIKKIIDAMCRRYGENVGGVFSFPTPSALVSAGVEGLSELKTGFRAKYIFDAASKVENGDIDLQKIYGMTYDDALLYLKTINGVGDKVASCVLLFAYNKYESFPVDVWIRKVSDKYFGGSLPDFGKYKGVFQQYLFYYERYVIG